MRHNSAYEQDSKVQFVIDAVYAFAYALQQLKNDVCPMKKGMCREMKRVDGGFFYKHYLLKTSFTGVVCLVFPFLWKNFANCFEKIWPQASSSLMRKEMALQDIRYSITRRITKLQDMITRLGFYTDP